MKINARCKPRAMALQAALALLAHLISAAALCAGAAEPLVWERRPNRPAPAQFDTYHGETLDFRCTFEGFGALPFEGASDVRLWYQTNGMGAAWWSVPATVSSNVLAAAWPPSADPGAGRVSFFFGAPSNAYAQAQVRFRNSPGPSPNNLDPPDVLDWQAELAAVSNALAAAIEAVATNLPPGMTTNDVCAIVTNMVDTWTVTVQSPGYDYWMVDQVDATFSISNVKWDGDIVSFIGNGRQISIVRDPTYYEVVRDRDVYLYVEDANNQIQQGSYPNDWVLIIGTTGGYDNSFGSSFENVKNNALGLAMASDLTNLVSQADGKMGVLNVGVNNAVTGARAAAIGTNNVASGSNAIAFGRDNTANSATAIALGRSNTAGGTFAMATGSGAVASNNYSFVWNRSTTRYGSHGTGTYNVNPQNGIYGLYIGEQNLYEAMVSAMTAKTPATVSFVDEDGNEESSRTYPAIAVATSADVAPLQSSVNTMWSTLYGESVWLAVTNYLRQIAGTVPSLRLWEVRDGVTNMVYSSAEEIEHVTTQRVDAAERRLAAMMPRTAWGSYQSTGEDNPSSNAVTVINSPKIMLTGGGEWYRTIETGGGSVWVLKTSGLMTGGGDTNGYFRVVDAEGNAQIEIVKTADQIVDAVASDVDFDAAGNFTVTFNASGSSHPIVSCADDLGDVFYEEDGNGEINALGITVAWARNSSNLWTATLHQDERAPHLFVYGKVLMQGSNLVRNAAPTSLDGGLYINSVRYRLVPYTTGGKTYLTLEAW